MLYIKRIDLDYILTKGIENCNLIDVRSPSEYLEDHIPTAVNIPLLDDNERAIVGTIYKKEGSNKAKLKGVEIVSPKIPQFINKIKKLVDNGKETVIYCWRGGDRSEAMCAFAKLAGLNVSKLAGGYKIFRKFVYNFFTSKFSLEYKPKIIVMYGPTGSAKTKILEELFKEGYPVINLEKHACHKGSSFGFIGEKGFDSITQKKFESRLWYNFYLLNYPKYILIEGESKKIGKVTIPDTLFSLMNSGISILTEPSLEFRVKYTLENYLPFTDINSITKALDKIKKYLGKKRSEQLINFYKNQKYEYFVKDLLENYYDPLYYKSLPDKIEYKISYNTIDEGIKNVKKILQSVFNNSCTINS
ncbi:rhodanese domain protein [Deferribacter desulfuricans SSM1]|uniref:Rhodanese domain protein n=1 Tax=Deferribacter desulfuricans (strain DSM 14783 / JCM 11476 / NBRC 101012 / SSM1) TaxID=639282 RepID=D3P9Y9_DEFDS|nr:tRNA 2-selenouridine(34) synthase MnmH [Deferribacter desulfuricans]BAI81529.1 rhodanese domain protein [Deferribacter desulfuricans SSM1]